MTAFREALEKSVIVVVLVALICAIGSNVRAESVTGDSGVPELKPMKKFFTLPNFRIGGNYDLSNEASYHAGGKNGITLESLGQPPLRLAYIAVGTPRKDAQGKITNAVVISPYYSGDSAFMYFYWFDGQKGTDFSKGPVVGPGKLIDTDKYYVVFLDALGLWGAGKPSDGLGLKFPKYSPYDVYTIFRDSKGHLWFGTSTLGACRYDGTSFAWTGHGENGSFGVRSIVEDKDGKFWLSNAMSRFAEEPNAAAEPGSPRFRKEQGIATDSDPYSNA